MDYDIQVLLNIISKEESSLFKPENKYIKELKLKSNKIFNLIKAIQSKDLISIKEYEEIHQYAITPGGFMTLEIRQMLYSKVFAIPQIASEYNFIFIEQSKIPDQKIDNYELDVFINKTDSFNQDKSNEKYIIEADVNRSKINLIFNNSDTDSNSNSDNDNHNHNDILLSYTKDKMIQLIKSQLKQFLIEMTSINNSHYNYYQGYHDIGLFFLLLYNENFRFAIESYQRFSEFFLKENLLDKDEGYSFTNTIVILQKIIEIIDEPAWNYIKEHFNGTVTFAISWILTCFSHNVNNYAIQYRLLDYFIVSHPISIYHLSSWIIIDEMNKMKKDNVEMDELSFYQHFQELNYDNIDYDYYIMKSENSMKKHSMNKIKETMKKLNMKHCFPLMNNESYAKKWIMRENANKEGYFWYLKGKFKAMWDIINTPFINYANN